VAIEVKNITKRFGNTLAANDISFSVPVGQVVGFLGPNGAGKTTTLRLLTGYIQPDKGNITLNGQPVTPGNIEARRQVGYLPENNPLYSDLYVRELLVFLGATSGLSGQLLRNRVEEVIEMTVLGDYARKPIHALSKGYRQRVGLAAALLNDPPILCLDEPTTGMDPNQVVEIRTLIRSLGTSKTVLFSSHIMQEVEAVASRILLIHSGALKLDTTLENITAEGKTLEHAFHQATQL